MPELTLSDTQGNAALDRARRSPPAQVVEPAEVDPDLCRKPLKPGGKSLGAHSALGVLGDIRDLVALVHRTKDRASARPPARIRPGFERFDLRVRKVRNSLFSALTDDAERRSAVSNGFEPFPPSFNDLCSSEPGREQGKSRSVEKTRVRRSIGRAHDFTNIERIEPFPRPPGRVRKSLARIPDPLEPLGVQSTQTAKESSRARERRRGWSSRSGDLFPFRLKSSA